MISRKELANAIRFLSIDAIQKANSGHPGVSMGMADIAEVLWRDYMNHNPKNPYWENRDRFVLSNGHASILLYSLLHLTGYDITICDLKKFRQLNSKTPGHPEYGSTPGVEATTGPLGQGIANAVGIAIAERILASQFNRPGYKIIDHFTYLFVGDGCIMEGISHEACSLAGTLNLGKLIVFYDSNGISIDGNIEGWFKDDTAKRFESYNWHVIENINGHDSVEIKSAIKEARQNDDKPSILICKTIIGFGSPNKAGTHYVHGMPLGKNEVIATRKKLSWKYSEFHIPKKIYDLWDARIVGSQKEKEWNNKFNYYKKIYPELANEFKRRICGNLPDNWNENSIKLIKSLKKTNVPLSTRQCSKNILEYFSKYLPELIGGSADLTPSNLTKLSNSKVFNENNNGNYIHYGVREFAMTAIINGIALYRGFIPYGGTFLIFMEYARNAIRMAAIMKIQNIQVYTHDSIALGEDGPTHQPIEQLANLRSTPNIYTWRPCDQMETAFAWKAAIERKNGPSALILSRQALPQIERTETQIENITKGAYIILNDIDEKIDVIIISTGSEVHIAMNSANILIKKGYKVRVVSMPSTEVFDNQNIIYKEKVLPKNIKNRVVIEAGIKDCWYKFVGTEGMIIGMNNFGESAPADILLKKFGFTAEFIAERIMKKMLK